MPADVEQKRVLITGGSRGIGLAVARAFLGRGATIAILSERAEVREVGDNLAREFNRAIVALHCDITDRAALGRAAAEFGAVDILVSNAGTGDITPIDSEAGDADELFERMIHINLIGAYNVVRAVLPLMSQGGRIIFTSSVHGQAIAPPHMSAYAASKGGLEAFMRSLARELGPRGINVNAVAPGMVATDLTLGAIRKLFGAQIADPTSGLTEEDMIRQLNASQAIHFRPIDPDALAETYLFLASRAGAEITGQSFNVDHGMMMK